MQKSNDTKGGPSGSALLVPDVECVIFDLDGTLVDTVELIRASMRHATGTVLGEPLPDEVLMRNVGVPLIVQMREFCEERADEMLAVYRAHNAEVHDSLICEYPGTEQVLDALIDRGYRLAIVTSKSRPVALRGLERFGLADRFEAMVAYEDVDRHKPLPDPLLKAAELLGVPIQRCAYVGDSPHDMSAAISAGALSIAALWGAFEAERVLEPGPAYALESIADLLPLLSGETGAYRVE